MRTQLEQDDIQAIASAVAEMLKPVIAGKGKNETDDAIFDVRALAEYLTVSSKWIYERSHLKEIPHLKVNGLLRFRKKEIDKWLSSFNVPAVEESSRILKAISIR